MVIDPTTNLTREREDAIPASKLTMGTHFQLTYPTATENTRFCDLLVNYVDKANRLDNEIMKNIFTFHLRTWELKEVVFITNEASTRFAIANPLIECICNSWKLTVFICSCTLCIKFNLGQVRKKATFCVTSSITCKLFHLN